MKKILFVVFATIAMGFTSCGNQVGSSEATDSVSVDTIDTVMVDTIVVDTTVVK